MHYLAVFLTQVATDDPHFDPENDPLETYMELDAARWERRKVHVFADGRIELASFEIETERTALSCKPIPSLEEIDDDPQFSGRISTQQEFETFWRQPGGSGTS